jgi:hypothetical protein
MASIVERHKIVAFYGVPGSNNSVTYYRMKKFTQFSHSKNPIEYSRQYVDEPFQQTDVVGFAPSYAYAFDKHTDLPIQADMVEITNDELLGDDAVRTIILVDLTTVTGTTTVTADAYKRDYSVIPNTEGDNINIYTYSGNLKARGEQEKITVSSADDWQTITIVD